MSRAGKQGGETDDLARFSARPQIFCAASSSATEAPNEEIEQGRAVLFAAHAGVGGGVMSLHRIGEAGALLLFVMTGIGAAAGAVLAITILSPALVIALAWRKLGRGVTQ